MTFHMPTVTLPHRYKYDVIMDKLIDNNNKLLVCPRYDSYALAKLVHNELLKLLYRDRRWSVPLHHAWGMPHITISLDEKIKYLAKSFANHYIYRNVFTDPQPVEICDKTWLITREDGSTFKMTI